MPNYEIKESGKLQDRLAHLRILDLIDTNFKGTMIFGRASEKKSFMFEDAKPYLMAQSVSEATLGRQLFEKNMITADQFAKVKALEVDGKHFFQALIEANVVDANLIFDFVLESWLQDLTTVVTWDAGQFACVEFLPKDIVKIDIRKKFQYYLFRALLGKNKKLKSKLSLSARFIAGSIAPIHFTVDDLLLNDLEKKVFDQLKESKPINKVAVATGNKEAVVGPILLTLRDIGVVHADIDVKVVKQVAIPKPVVVPTAEETTKIDDDFLKKIQKLDDMDFYEILGVSREAPAAEIQTRYFTLAKKYHPDRIKDNTLVPRKEIERLFAKITEAYNTLSNMGLRKEYEMNNSRANAAHEELMARIVKSENMFLEGVALLNKNMVGEAVQKFKDAIQLYDQEPEYKLKLGWATFRQGVKENNPAKTTEGKKSLVDIHKHGYFTAEVTYYLGMVAKQENKPDQAIGFFRLCIQAEPTHALAASEMRVLEKKKR